MKSRICYLFIILSIPVISSAAWKNKVNYNVTSGKTYHNKELHLYKNTQAEKLLLTGNSFLSLNGGSLLSNAIAKNNSSIHMYISDTETSGRPAIQNTEINNYSILTMESFAVSTGTLNIGKNAQLNITHVDNDSCNGFCQVPEVSGNVHIENLNLAGKAFISPMAILADEYEESDYLKKPGNKVITRIDNLTMQPGSLISIQEYIPHMQFNQLQINNLSGKGMFIMGTHIAQGLGDNILVSEKASGHFALMIADSGHNAITPQRIDLVSVYQGNARFDLINRNGIVEVGTWQYTLQHDQNQGQTDWYLACRQHSELPIVNEARSESLPETPNASPATLRVPERTEAIEMPSASNTLISITPPTPQNNTVPELSHSAKAIINIATAFRHILITEMSTLSQRIGNMHHHDDKLTLWVGYLKDNSYLANHYGSAIHNQLQGMQIGMDNSTEFNQGRWLLGALISDSKTSVHSGSVSNGNIRSQGGGIYTTWLDNSGIYWDNLVKLNHFNHHVRTQMYNGRITLGHYHQYGISVASEAGSPLHWN